MNLSERYEEEIDKFFQGDEIDPYPQDKGHVWIYEHRQYFGEGLNSTLIMETLTAEPVEGGQYEIAMRVPKCDGRTGRDQYSGYIADNGYLRGRNTGGH